MVSLSHGPSTKSSVRDRSEERIATIDSQVRLIKRGPPAELADLVLLKFQDGWGTGLPAVALPAGQAWLWSDRSSRFLLSQSVRVSYDTDVVIMKSSSFTWFRRSTLFAISRVSFVVVASLLICAGSLRAQTRIFLEDFEGVFPGTNWTVSDLGSGEFPAYWDDVNLLSFGSPPARAGSWAGYCAGIGYAGTFQFPDYQPDMLAVMERTVDLTAETNATLSFWFTIPSIQPGWTIAGYGQRQRALGWGQPRQLDTSENRT